MPRSNPKMRMGSRTAFSTAPRVVESMAYLGLPSARISWLAPVPSMARGVPKATMRVYSMAYSRVCPRPPKAVRMGRKKRRVSTASTTPVKRVRVRLVPATDFAFCSSLLPRYRLKADAPPTPKVMASAATISTRGNTTLVAALPSSPTLFPTKIWSTTL